MVKGNTQHETAKESRWCLELLMTLKLMHCTSLPELKCTDDLSAIQATVLKFYKWPYAFNFGCDALWCYCTKNVKAVSFKCFSLSISLSETRNVVAIETIWLVWTVSLWYSFHHIEPLFLPVLVLVYILFLSFPPLVSWIYMSLFVETLFKINVQWSPSLSLFIIPGGLSVQPGLLPLLSSERTHEVLFILVYLELN